MKAFCLFLELAILIAVAMAVRIAFEVDVNLASTFAMAILPPIAGAWAAAKILLIVSNTDAYRLLSSASPMIRVF